MTQRKLRKTPCLFAVLAALLMMLTGCAKEAEQRSLSVNELNSSRYTIGVDQGSMSDLIAEEVFSEANFEYFSDKFMGYKAVADGKVDAFVYDRRQMEIAIEKGLTGVGLLDETLGQPIDIAVGLSPVSGIDDLEGKINAFIAEIRSDGTLDDMFRRWVSEGNDVMPDIPAPDAPTEHLTVATSGIVEPFSYYGETGLTGYDIELATRFASWLNAELEFKIYDYGAIVAAAQSGDVDCIMADLNVSEERRQELPFSDILFSETAGIMVREGASESASLEYKNFDQLSGHRIGVL
ncbi:MAG: transporter substrate-binding domain-containing protein, partial [bacterium]